MTQRADVVAAHRELVEASDAVRHLVVVEALSTDQIRAARDRLTAAYERVVAVDDEIVAVSIEGSSV
jgi:hypothetical protein